MLAGVRFAGLSLSHNNQARLLRLRDSTCYFKPPNHCWFASVPQRCAHSTIKPPVEISGVDMGRIRQAIAG